MRRLPLKELKTALYQRLKTAFDSQAPAWHLAPFAALEAQDYPICVIAGLGGEEDLDSRDATVDLLEATLELRADLGGAEDLLEVLNVVQEELSKAPLALPDPWEDLGLTYLKRLDVGAAWEDSRALMRALATYSVQITYRD